MLAGLESQRIASQGCFDVGPRIDDPVRVFPAAADGADVLLRPLAPGRHTIEFGGVLPGLAQVVSDAIEAR